MWLFYMFTFIQSHEIKYMYRLEIDKVRYKSGSPRSQKGYGVVSYYNAAFPYYIPM